MEYRRSRRAARSTTSIQWDAERLRALRRHLGLSQSDFAGELGVQRQQTISEWETGAYRPRGASARLLAMIAEEAGFRYEAAAGEAEGDNHVDSTPEPAGDTAPGDVGSDLAQLKGASSVLAARGQVSNLPLPDLQPQ
ncbi:MAG: helix-turn-helix domain-containing protein [Dehalococcoidia bacterium]